MFFFLRKEATPKATSSTIVRGILSPKIKNIETNKIFLGNGSDEVIDLLMRIFAEPKKDKILVFNPTYGMYEVSANINDVEVVSYPLNQDFQIEFSEELEQILKDENSFYQDK